ncbi:MAG: gliding motility lipoprotein GldD [Bacteroidales bacterium]|nr:gliding motility lipoprotein GldD [Bacteroidales bacterium]MBR6278826.1 gliding motility lipoprotein GldD [Bacteroidales bacterium]
MKKHIQIFITVFTVFMLFSCSHKPTPKPRGYFRITFPEKEYSIYDSLDLPYSFAMPNYCIMEKENSRGAEKYWTNIVFKGMNAKIHITFTFLNNNLDTLIEDSHTLAYKHTVKADAIEKISYYNDSTRVYGLMYNLKGNVASPVQFYLTDSTKHFLRGSLYFNSSPNKDSLLPAVNFIREDIKQIFETLQWK